MTKINIDHNTVLQDNTLKAFVNALQAQLDFDRSVRVICDEGFVSFQLMTIEEEAEMEVS